MSDPGAPITCPSCAYALAGLHSLKCPECGYIPEPEELAGAERRRIYFELTRWAQFAWISHVALIALFALALNVFRPWTSYAVGLALYSIPGFVVGQWSIARRVPQAYRPLVRRMWRQNLLWMQLPWLAVALGFIAIRLLAFALQSLGATGLAKQIEGLLWNNEFRTDPGFTTILTLGFAGLAFAPIAWRWRWRGLVAASGLPARTHDQVGMLVAMRAALLPAVLVVVVPTVLASVLLLIERLAPNWWARF